LTLFLKKIPNLATHPQFYATEHFAKPHILSAFYFARESGQSSSTSQELSNLFQKAAQAIMLPKFDPTDQKACLSLLEDVTTNVKQIQDSVLEAILSRNAHTEYLSGFLNGQADKKSFKKNVPVVTYEDIKPYIDRIANGEPSDLICDRPISVLLTRYLPNNFIDLYL
jgi:hypothetical protein